MGKNSKEKFTLRHVIHLDLLLQLIDDDEILIFFFLSDLTIGATEHHSV